MISYDDFKSGWEFPGGKIEEGETPQEEDNDKKYYVCVSVDMRKEKNMLNCKLYDSRLMVLEECGE